MTIPNSPSLVSILSEDPDLRTMPRQKRQRVFSYYLRVLHKTMTALDLPDAVRFYIETVLINLGFDRAPDQWSQLEDEKAVKTVTTSYRAADGRDLARQKAKLRKQRERMNDYQEEDGNPSIIRHRLNTETTEGGETRSHSQYQLPIVGLLRRIFDAAPVGSSDRRLDQAIKQCVGEFLHEQAALRKRPRKRRERSAEANINQGITLILKGLGAVEKMEDHQAAEHVMTGQILPTLTDFLPSDFLSNLPGFRLLAKKAPVTVVTGPNEEESQGGGFFITEDSINNVIKNQDDFPASPSEQIPSEHAVSTPPKPHGLGMSNEEFRAKTFGTPDKPKSKDGGGLPVTDAQRSLLLRAGEFDIPATRGEASERIGELIASGALSNFLSLEEIKQYNGHSGHGSGKEKRFCCPPCGKSVTRKHEDMAVNLRTGEYYCHVCKTGGIVREHLENMPPSPARFFPAPPPPEQPKAISTDDKWRKWVAEAKPITGTPGAAYIESRGLSADVAERAGVRFGTWWKASDEGNGPERFDAVIFPIHNEDGEIVAASARSITGNTKRTKGEKSQGVFMTSPDVLKSERIGVTEAPIDALALAAAGIPAIAMCGTSWPEWLIDALSGRDVLIATDDDKAGNEAAEKLHAELLGLAAPVSRFRPSGGKDWAEVAQRHGLDSIAAQFEYLTGEAGSDEMHDSPLIGETDQ